MSGVSKPTLPIVTTPCAPATSPVPTALSPDAVDVNDDGLTIPRPDNVPQRKVSGRLTVGRGP